MGLPSGALGELDWVAVLVGLAVGWFEEGDGNCFGAAAAIWVYVREVLAAADATLRAEVATF